MVVVHGAFHRSEDLRNDLPLVDQQWLVVGAQCRIGIGPERDRIRWTVEPHDGAGPPSRRGGLADTSRTDDHDRRKFGQQAADQAVGQTRDVDAGHAAMISLLRADHYRFYAAVTIEISRLDPDARKGSRPRSVDRTGRTVAMESPRAPTREQTWQGTHDERSR